MTQNNKCMAFYLCRRIRHFSRNFIHVQADAKLAYKYNNNKSGYIWATFVGCCRGRYNLVHCNVVNCLGEKKNPHVTDPRVVSNANVSH